MAQEAHNLTITVSGYTSLNGAVFIAVYNSADTYMKLSKVALWGVIKPTAYTVSYTFQKVPNGAYAATVFYDENGNGKLDKNILGIPTEKSGFSNNVKAILGPAKFDKVKFIHNNDQQIAIKVE